MIHFLPWGGRHGDVFHWLKNLLASESAVSWGSKLSKRWFIRHITPCSQETSAKNAWQQAKDVAEALVAQKEEALIISQHVASSLL